MSKILLHVGCGPLDIRHIPYITDRDQWIEKRLDIDAEHEPDYLCSMLDMHCVESESIDLIHSSHNLEHLYPFQVPIALNEFLRVLKPNGILICNLPDLEAVAKQIVYNGLTAPAYELEGGQTINALDMLYGWTRATENGNDFMAHKCGFTSESLQHELECVGFKNISIMTDTFDLIAAASK